MRKFRLFLLLLTLIVSGYDYPTVPNTFVPRQVIESSKVNANFTAGVNSDSDGTKKHNLAELNIKGVRIIDDSRNVSANNIVAVGISANAVTVNGTALSDAISTINTLVTSANTLTTIQAQHTITINTLVNSANNLTVVQDQHASTINTLVTSANQLSVSVNSIQSDLNGFPDELKNLTTAEIQQVENIGTEAISATEWGYVAALNQGLTTASNVQFGNITGTLTTAAQGNVTSVGTLTSLGLADAGIQLGSNVSVFGGRIFRGGTELLVGLTGTTASDQLRLISPAGVNKHVFYGNGSYDLAGGLNIGTTGAGVGEVRASNGVFVGTKVSDYGMGIKSYDDSWLVLGIPGTTGTNKMVAITKADGSDVARFTADGNVKFFGDHRILGGLNVGTAGDAAVAGYVKVQNEVNCGTALGVYHDIGDAKPRIQLYVDGAGSDKGAISFSDGTNAADTNLYRNATDNLKTDDTLTVAGALNVSGNAVITGTTQFVGASTLASATVSGTLNATLTTAAQPNITSVGNINGLTVVGSGVSILSTSLTLSNIDSRVIFDSDPRFQLLGNGKLLWGAGDGVSVDTNLYRDSANVLKTDDSLTVAGALNVSGNATFTNGIDAGGNGKQMKCKVIAIGDWDMDATSFVDINVGVSYDKIQIIYARVIGDIASIYENLCRSSSGGVAQGSIDGSFSTYVTLSRTATGIYDSTDYNATSYNRGHITIWYEQ